MGELVTFIPKLAVSGRAVQSELPATIVIFPGVRYEREDEGRQSRATRRDENGAADNLKA